MHRGKQRGAPLPKQIKTEHPREARKSPAGHPRDAPRRIEAQEARRSMQGVEPSGHPRDGPRKAKGAPLQKQVKVEHPREARNSPAGHPSDAPRRMEAQEAHKVDARHRTRRSSKGCTEAERSARSAYLRSLPGIRPGGHPRGAPRKQRKHPYQSLAKPSILGKLGDRCKASDQAVILGMHRGG
jgi:hypothetical protein